MLPRDLGIFAPVIVQLDIMDSSPAIECDGAIVWIVKQREEQDNENYDTGIEFTNLNRRDAERINNVVEKVLKEV